jgi:hypothetical protein
VLRDARGWTLFGLLWSLAALDVTVKAEGGVPSRHYTGLFRVMGGCRRAALVSHADSGHYLASGMTDTVCHFFEVLSFEA